MVWLWTAGQAKHLGRPGKEQNREKLETFAQAYTKYREEFEDLQKTHDKAIAALKQHGWFLTPSMTPQFFTAPIAKIAKEAKASREQF